MKKLILFTLFLFIQFACFAQNEEDERDRNYYKYLIVSYAGALTYKDITVNVDDGKTIDYCRNEKGEKGHFRTPAVAIVYFESLGWEFKTINSYPNGTLTYLMFKKQCSKEEYEKIIKDNNK